MERQKVELSLDIPYQLFQQSVNRVNYFSCITNNLGDSSLPQAWYIKSPNEVNFQLSTLSQEDRTNFLEAYKHFMYRYLVRDCIETFALCLDSIFFHLLLNGKSGKPDQKISDVFSEEETRNLTKFQDSGISAKIKMLRTIFNVKLDADHIKVVNGLKSIRDCLSHRNGTVSNSDGQSGKNGQRVFHWYVFTFFMVGVESKKKSKLVFNRPLTEASDLCMQIKESSKNFGVGQQLIFSPSECYEIAFSLDTILKKIFTEINSKILNL